MDWNCREVPRDHKPAVLKIQCEPMPVRYAGSSGISQKVPRAGKSKLPKRMKINTALADDDDDDGGGGGNDDDDGSERQYCRHWEQTRTGKNQWCINHQTSY